MLAGMSRDDNRPTDQYRARAARRWIPQSSTYSMQDCMEKILMLNYR
jgi:hypothetical protein